MAKVTKDIATEGTFMVADDLGNRHVQTLSRDRFGKWIETFHKLSNKGYNTPTPFDHDTVNGVPVKFGRNGVPKALENAGFLDDLRQELRPSPTEPGKSIAVLVGDFDIPGEETDANSPAYKVGKTVKETSVYVRPNFTDGTGETHDEALMHVALVVHPIEPGQGNFKPTAGTAKPGYAIAMSQMIPVVMSTSAPGALAASFEGKEDDEQKLRDQNAGGALPPSSGGDQTQQLVIALRDAKIMDLPENTDASKVIEYMLVAVRQKNLVPTSQFVPPGQQPQAAPVPGGAPQPGMGQPGQPPLPGADPAAQPQGQQPTGQQPGAAPPAPGQQPPTPNSPSNPIDLRKPPKAAVEQPPTIAMSTQAELVMSQQVTELTSANKVLATYVTNLEADKRLTRINSLVTTGRCTQAYADASLKPMLGTFQMSLGADGKPAKAAIDTVLECLEAQPAKTGSVINSLSNLNTPNLGGLPEDTRNVVASVLMSMAGGGLPPGAVEQISDSFANPNAALTDTEGVSKADEFLKMVNG